ncbi:hypothetical protein ACQPZF_07650 [Actinosynnema sp. CS-041913]|uniref:hypothetical protein n=1 Tax=Actinosynnema sp. CS-041913 TaxID=3239917 RepID=UPI003D8B0B02
MDTDDIENHPDLRDGKWIAEADRRARKEIRRQRRKARRKASTGKVVTAVAVVAIAALLYGLYREGEFAGIEEAVNTPAQEAFEVDFERPFLNTPAAGWADGEAGVVAPEAQAVGGFSAEQVADAYGRVKQAVVASRLDRRVIQDHDVEPYIGLFAYDLQDHLRQQFDGRHDPEASMVVTRIAKGQRLLPVAPKVNGTMRAEAGQDGELFVHTDYVFAYAFATDKTPFGPMDIIALRRVEMSYVLRTGDAFSADSRGLWTDQTAGFDYAIACTASKQGFLAPGISERATTDFTDDKPSEDYFDLDQSLDVKDGCPE